MLVKKSNLFSIVPFLSFQKFNDEDTIIVLNPHLFKTLKVLKSHVGYRYNLLTCISGVDLIGKKYRFSVVYDLLSLIYNSRLRVKIFVDEITFVQSSVEIFVNANWWEREIWDLYGIYFDKHPELRRILTDYGFEGHPFRKDFPLNGNVELCYSESKKRVVTEPVILAQEFRSFTFETPW